MLKPSYRFKLVLREPVKIKENIKRRRAACEGDGCDRFAIWFGNELAKYLWDHWGNELKARGISWVEFLKMLSNYNDLIISWAIKGSLTWDELARRLYEGIVKGSSRGDLTRFLA